jgi:hypothetical protein
MASTVSSKTLTVTINETIDLTGDDYSSRHQLEIKGINEISKRIFTVPTYKTSVLVLSSSNGAGTFASSSLKYARITNLDNSNFVQLTFASSSAGVTKNKCEFKLEPLRSFIICNDAYSGSDAGDAFGSFASFTDLKAKSDTAACDIELYVATT